MDRAAGIVCDAKSGVSGAGRKPSLKSSFCEVTENFSAYSILNHRHVPEVLLVSGLEEREFSFTAQLLPSTAAFWRPSTSAQWGRRSPKTYWPSTRNATRASRSSGSTIRATCPICTAWRARIPAQLGPQMRIPVSVDAAEGRAAWSARPPPRPRQNPS